jgi:hypothetical protein
LLEEYPSMLLNTSLQIVFAIVQSFFMALVMERDFSRWKLGLDVGLVAIIYCVSIRIPSATANPSFFYKTSLEGGELPRCIKKKRVGPVNEGNRTQKPYMVFIRRMLPWKYKRKY